MKLDTITAITIANKNWIDFGRERDYPLIKSKNFDRLFEFLPKKNKTMYGIDIDWLIEFINANPGVIVGLGGSCAPVEVLNRYLTIEKHLSIGEVYVAAKHFKWFLTVAPIDSETIIHHEKHLTVDGVRCYRIDFS